MKHSLVVLALVTAAGTALAQTAATPPAHTPSIRGNVVTPAAPAAPSMNTPGPSTQAPMGTGGMPSTANAPPMPNAPGSANVLKKIEADGYKNVSDLTRNPDGSWSGKAMRGSTMADVMVDARGNVTTR